MLIIEHPLFEREPHIKYVLQLIIYLLFRGKFPVSRVVKNGQFSKNPSIFWCVYVRDTWFSAIALSRSLYLGYNPTASQVPIQILVDYLY